METLSGTTFKNGAKVTFSAEGKERSKFKGDKEAVYICAYASYTAVSIREPDKRHTLWITKPRYLKLLPTYDNSF